MVWHVGISPHYEKVEAFNEKNGKTISFDIEEVKPSMVDNFQEYDIDSGKPRVIDHVHGMFEEIEAEIHGEIGSACLVLHENYNYDNRRKFIDIGKLYGFLNIHFIDFDTSIFLSYISQTRYKPKNGDLIWIFFNKYCILAEKRNGKFILLDHISEVDSDVENILSIKSRNNIKKDPNLIIYDKNCAIKKSLIQFIFDCEMFVCDIDLIKPSGALIKARIMAHDLDVFEFDTTSVLYSNIYVTVNHEITTSFWGNELLPIKKIINLPLNGDEKLLKIEANVVEGQVRSQFYEEIENLRNFVPAAFSAKQKLATHVVANLAGWKTIHLLAEPIAAAIAYFVDKPIPPEFTLLLFDLGGGTLDICIFKISKGKLKIVANYGDAHLGGRDFDKILFDYFAMTLKTSHNFDVKINENCIHKLMTQCMEIKHALSTEAETSLDVSEIRGSLDFYLKITRADFETLSESLLARMKEITIQSLSFANYALDDIKKVLLVGGGCRMPMVQELLRKMFTKSEHSCDENPDEVVAIGAAHFASYLNSKDASTYNCSII